MGNWLKDVFQPKKAEKERYNNALNGQRKLYPKLTFDKNQWARVSPTSKIKQCNALKIKVEELRIKAEQRAEDVARSDGHRADERMRDVYRALHSEYKEVYRQRYCDTVLDTAKVNEDRIKAQEIKKASAERQREDLDKQRTIIMGVGGAVLLIGTVIILRKV